LRLPPIGTPMKIAPGTGLINRVAGSKASLRG
jgi:hypothetical protein